MRRFTLTIFILLFLSSFCFAKEQKQTKVIEIYVGQSFTITLESNATTGYRWQFAKPLDKDMLELESSSYSGNNPKLIGSPGKQVWTINALKAGKTNIFFKYARSWEKGKPPIKEDSFVVIIKEKQADSPTATEKEAAGVRVSGDLTVANVNRKGL
ncbi:MAG: protease inhibitor I42 family protein [Candidatus Omnitrophota bacterium]|jgi:inhibitor of cysteine peptidase